MKDFYMRNKVKILIGGAFVVLVIVLLTLSFGDTGAIVTN